MVSLDHLRSNLSRAYFLLYSKRKVLLVMFSNIYDLLIIDLESLNFKIFSINICIKITIQTFKTILGIDIHFEVRNKVHG